MTLAPPMDAMLNTVPADDPPDSSPAARHTLQQFLTPVGADVAELYLRGDGVCVPDGGSIRLEPGAVASFDTYVNSFYEGYWSEHAAFGEAALTLCGEGRCRIVINRSSASGGAQAVLDRPVKLERFEDLVLEPPAPSDAGADTRLHVVVEAGSQGVVIDRLAWTTRRPPLRNVSLGIGLSTFNRQDYLSVTLQRLQADAPAVAAVVVVNQGAPFSPELRRLLNSPCGRFKAVEQENFGGAGGFTRAAIELLDDARVTHIVFMDDDIEVDVRHLATAQAFLSYARAPLVVGGQMLDIHQRFRMVEGGSRLTADNILQVNHGDLDLSRSEALDAVARKAPCHYNGWWFAIVPSAVFRRHGLPAPVFIRGDDQELGVRLMQLGVPTVSLPPLSVWHAPPDSKPPGWPLYYDLRNRLILASVHAPVVGLDPPSRLAKIVLAMLARYDYQFVAALELALRDFLKGPRLLDRPAAAAHDRLVAALRRQAPTRAADLTGLAPAHEPPAEARGSNRGRRMLWLLFRAAVGVPAANPAGGAVFTHPEAPLSLMRLGRSYVLTDPQRRRYALRFDHSAASTWVRGLSALALVARYAVGRSGAARRWRESIPLMTTRESWERRLNLAPVSAPPESPRS